MISTPERKTTQPCAERKCCVHTHARTHTHTKRVAEIIEHLLTNDEPSTHIYGNQNASGHAQHLRTEVLVPQLRAVGVTGNTEQQSEKTG